MSLIGEALKKAHLEAVRQDGSRSRLAHTPGVAQYRQPQGGARRSWTAALIVSNVLLAILVGAAVVWKTGGRADSVIAATPPITPPAATASPANEATPTPLSNPTDAAPERAATQLRPASNPEPARSSRPVAPEPASQKETAIARPVPVPEEAAPPPPSRPPALTAVDGLVAGQTYMRSIPSPEGSELVLSGMSVAGGRGVALINSRMVREGDRVGPFVVGPIADRRVALDYKGITVYLKMP